MLHAKHLSFALIISLGSVGSAVAAPITLDLANPELLAEAARNTFAHSDNSASDIDLSSINISYGIQNRASDFNFLKNDIVKATVKPVKVAEPSAVMLLALGLIGLTVLRRRKH